MNELATFRGRWWRFTRNASARTCAGFRLSNEMSTVDVFSCDGSAMGIRQRSRYGMTFTHLKVESGRELLTSYLADSRVRHFPQLHAGEKPQLTCGLKCDGSLGKLNRPMCSPRTSQRPLLNKLQAIAPKWAIKPKCFPYQRQTGRRPRATKVLFTCIRRRQKPTMQHHQCKSGGHVEISGASLQPTPENQEWLMAWPIGWSDTKPLAMDKFQRWQQQLCGHFANVEQ